MDSFLEKTILDGRPVTHVTSAGKTSLTEDCFCTKAPADTRLDHTNFGRRNVQRISYDPSDMKRDLGGRNHRQSLKMVHITVGYGRSPSWSADLPFVW